LKRPLAWASSVVCALIFLSPLLWAVIASFRESGAIFSGGLEGLPSTNGWTLGNYTTAVRRAHLTWAIGNSLLQVASISGAGLLVNAMAAFAFARLRFFGRDLLFAVVVAFVILPVEVLAVPMFLTVRDLGLTGGYVRALLALSLPFVAKAFNIYFLRQHFLSLPAELEEAAVIDGAGVWRQFWNIALPAVRPALATVVLLDLLVHWGDFLWPLLIATREDTRTVQIGLANLFTQPPIDWGAILACSVLATLPVLASFRLFQRYIVTSDSRVGIR
jgi:ABC-type glycerol-3-phosphate transport system permease component